MTDPTIQAGNSSSPTSHSSKWWLFPVLLLGSLSLLQIVMVVIAVNDPQFSVVPDYYKKAVDWDKQRELELSSQALDWKLDLRDGQKLGAGSLALISIQDAQQDAVKGAELTIAANHLAHGKEVIHLRASEDLEGQYQLQLPSKPIGLWELRVEALRGKELFLKKVRVELE